MYNVLRQKINHVNFIFKGKTNCLVGKSEHEADYLFYKFYEDSIKNISKEVRKDIEQYKNDHTDVKSFSEDLKGLLVIK